MCDMSAANTAATAITVWYWTSAGWKQFLDDDGVATTVDYTEEVDTKTLSRAAAGDKSRIVWWTQPTDWIAGGPSGSGANDSTYCVGIQVDGALTSLAGCSVYPVLDRPLANIQLGSAEQTTDAYYSYKGATWASTFDIDAWGAAGDYLYVATDRKWQSLYVDMSANVNAVATGITFAYWNGVEWVTATCTDGTAAVPGTPFAQDGWITFTAPIAPIDWKKCAGSDIDENLDADGEYYWFRIARSSGGTTSAATAVTAVEANVLATNVWHYFDVHNDGFVDDDERINFLCMLENADVDAVEIAVIASDI